MKKICPYCGNNPVPHWVFWYNESLNIFLTPLRQKILYNGLTRLLKKRRWDIKLAFFFFRLGEFFKIIGRQTDISKCKVRRAQVLWEEALKRGIKMQELLLFGYPFDCYVAEQGNPLSLIHNPLPSGVKDKGSRIVFSGLPRPAGYQNHWLDLMDDKWLFKEVMRKNRLPVPAGGSVTSFGQALEIFRRIGKPVIVKPRAGSRGRHSTTFVFSEADLQRAFKISKKLCHWVMVEEQLSGPVFRATVVNFELCGVLRGDPPQVIGNSTDSIAELIKQKNQVRCPGVKNIAVDAGLEIFLSRQNFILTSVPKNGELVNLSEKIGVNYGGSSSEDYEICHSENKTLFAKAAKLLGDPIVGFDFIIPDITKPWREQKCGFIEVNSLPFINLHHDPLHGQPRNVAAKVWEMVGW